MIPNINLAQKASYSVKRKLCLKCIIFFISGLMFLVFFWMLLSSFGAVYQNTQIFILKNTLISFAIDLLYPFIFNIFPGLFRIYSLNSKKSEYLHNFSKILQIK